MTEIYPTLFFFFKKKTCSTRKRKKINQQLTPSVINAKKCDSFFAFLDSCKIMTFCEEMLRKKLASVRNSIVPN